MADKITKKRRSVHSVVGGKALEGETVKKLKEYYLESSTRKPSVTVTKAKSGKSNSKVQKPKKITRKSKQIENTVTVPDAPQPGPSRLSNSPVEDDEDTPVQTESQIPTDEKCCVCKRFYVARDRTDGTLFITNLGSVLPKGLWTLGASKVLYKT